MYYSTSPERALRLRIHCTTTSRGRAERETRGIIRYQHRKSCKAGTAHTRRPTQSTHIMLETRHAVRGVSAAPNVQPRAYVRSTVLDLALSFRKTCVLRVYMALMRCLVRVRPSMNARVRRRCPHAPTPPCSQWRPNPVAKAPGAMCGARSDPSFRGDCGGNGRARAAPLPASPVLTRSHTTPSFGGRTGRIRDRTSYNRTLHTTLVCRS